MSETRAELGTGALTIHRLATNGLPDSTQLAGAAMIRSSADYNSSGETQNLRYSGAVGTLYQQSLGRDVMGRITGTNDAVQGTATVHGYRYDDPGRLYGVTTGPDTVARFWYDANGNRIAVWTASGIDTATYDAQDRLLSYGHLSAGYARYSYTNNGDLTQRVSPQGTTRYTYDALGNLTGAHLPSGDSLVYLIDGENRRVGKKFNGSLQKAWLYENALSPVAELDGTGALVSRFVYGTQPNVPEYMVKSGVTYRIVTDQLGSVRLVMSAADGSITQRLDYDAWGNVLTDTSPGFQPFGFAGGLYDPDTRLMRFGARDYDASVGRWTCKDPLTVASSTSNVYQYAGNLPVLLIDPFGLLWVYSQSTGTMVHIDDNTGAMTTVGVGKSGNGDPASQGIKNIGPLPQGSYTIGPAQTNVTLSGTILQYSMRLVPDPKNKMFARGGFLIHGGSHSTGCILLPLPARKAIGKSGDHKLKVVQ